MFLMLTKIFSVQEKDKPLCGVALMLSYPQEKSRFEKSSLFVENQTIHWEEVSFLGKKARLHFEK